MSAKTIPVVVFAYKRPDLLSQLLSSLKQDHIPLLLVFSDAAREVQDVVLVNEVRHIVHAIDWCETIVVERPHNLGLGVSIRTGVTQVLAQYQAAIVYEDDLICMPGTYNYLTSALDYYAECSQVMSVTGWTHPRITPAGVGVLPYFDGKAECWGWGTWARAWQGMESSARELMARCTAKGINPEEYGSDLPKMAEEEIGKNLWAVRWWYHHLLHGGLCLRPPYSMIEHIGWDTRGTTVTPAMRVWENPPLQACPAIPEYWIPPMLHPECSTLWRIATGDAV